MFPVQMSVNVRFVIMVKKTIVATIFDSASVCEVLFVQI